MASYTSPFAVIPLNVVAFLAACRATGTEFALITAIYSYRSDKDPCPYPSQATLSRVTGINRRRIQEAQASLVRDGILAIGKRTIDRGQNEGWEVNTYNLPALEKLATDRPEGVKRTKNRPQRGILHNMEAKAARILANLDDSVIDYDWLIERTAPWGAREEVAKCLDKHLASYHCEIYPTLSDDELKFYRRIPFDEAAMVEVMRMARSRRYAASSSPQEPDGTHQP